jgi:hypothetical protein
MRKSICHLSTIPSKEAGTKSPTTCGIFKPSWICTKKRFEAEDQKEIADELEECIHLLIGAQMVAQTLDFKDRGGR